jgi:hypothetical protein
MLKVELGHKLDPTVPAIADLRFPQCLKVEAGLKLEST